MKAVVLAGGFGTRLRPITYRCPKPMVPIRGKPFIEYLMNGLKNQGITEVILCLHYMADKFIEYFGGGSNFGLRITYSVEKKPLGTAGAIRNVEDYLDGTFLVLNGDTYVNLDFQGMLAFHSSNEAFGTIALVKVKNPSRYGLVDVSEDLSVTGFSEKTCIHEGYVNAGVYIFEDRILGYIPKNEKVSLEKEVLPSLLGKERIFGFLIGGYFVDIGIPEDYYRFQREMRGVLWDDH